MNDNDCGAIWGKNLGTVRKPELDAAWSNGNNAGIAKGRAEGKAEGRTETAADLLAIGKMTEAEIAVFFNFTPKQMEAVMDIYRKKVVAE